MIVSKRCVHQTGCLVIAVTLPSDIFSGEHYNNNEKVIISFIYLCALGRKSPVLFVSYRPIKQNPKQLTF